MGTLYFAVYMLENFILGYSRNSHASLPNELSSRWHFLSTNPLDAILLYARYAINNHHNSPVLLSDIYRNKNGGLTAVVAWHKGRPDALVVNQLIRSHIEQVLYLGKMVFVTENGLAEMGAMKINTIGNRVIQARASMSGMVTAMNNEIFRPLDEGQKARDVGDLLRRNVEVSFKTIRQLTVNTETDQFYLNISSHGGYQHQNEDQTNRRPFRKPIHVRH